MGPPWYMRSVIETSLCSTWLYLHHSTK